MFKQFLLLAFCAFGLVLPVCAADTGSTVPPSDPRDAWKSESALLRVIQSEIGTGGVLAVQNHAEAMEKALAAATTSYVSSDHSGQIYFLADGTAEMLVLTALPAVKDSPFSGKPVAVYANPYPETALLLALYYDEVGRTADGLRVLNRGLELSSLQDLHLAGVNLGETRPLLFAERGAVLDALHRSSDALADFDEALTIPNLPAALHAKLLRGRGFALSDLGRLDDAEKAYRDSLSLQPNNAVAISELAYITRLKSGGAPAASALTSVQPKSRPKP